MTVAGEAGDRVGAEEARSDFRRCLSQRASNEVFFPFNPCLFLLCMELEQLESQWNRQHYPALKLLSGQPLARAAANYYAYYSAVVVAHLPPLEAVVPVHRVERVLQTGPAQPQQLQFRPATDPETCLRILHRCLVYIGDLARYRGATRTAIELYRLAIWVRPQSGLPFHHIAIVDQSAGERFNTTYNLARAAVAAEPHPNAQDSLWSLLKSHPLALVPTEALTKNERMDLLKTQFLCLTAHFSQAKPVDKLIQDIEDSFYVQMYHLDFHKQLFNDFVFKQLAILLALFELLINPSQMEKVECFLKFCLRYVSQLLDIFEREWDIHFNTRGDTLDFSTSLLPSLRLLVCWFGSRQLVRVYADKNVNEALACVANRMLDYLKTHPRPQPETDFNITYLAKPVRSRLFKEDLTISNFRPINNRLDDFDDSHLYKPGKENMMARFGEGEVNKEVENTLRMEALVYMIRRVLEGSAIEWSNGKFVCDSKPVDLKLRNSRFEKTVPSPSNLPRQQQQPQQHQHQKQPNLSTATTVKNSASADESKTKQKSKKKNKKKKKANNTATQPVVQEKPVKNKGKSLSSSPPPPRLSSNIDHININQNSSNNSNQRYAGSSFDNVDVKLPKNFKMNKEPRMTTNLEDIFNGLVLDQPQNTGRATTYNPIPMHQMQNIPIQNVPMSSQIPSSGQFASPIPGQIPMMPTMPSAQPGSMPVYDQMWMKNSNNPNIWSSTDKSWFNYQSQQNGHGSGGNNNTYGNTNGIW